MPRSQAAVRDRRVLRTNRLLLDSLRKLLRDKPIDEIVVSDITQAADVNRATFYDHYADKFDIFNALIAADFRDLMDRRNVCFDGSCATALATIVIAAGEFLQQIHRDNMACTLRPPSGALVDAAMMLAIRGIVLDGLKKKDIPTEAPREVFASMLSGTIYGAVKQVLAGNDWVADEPSLLSLVPQMQPLLDGNLPPAA